MPAVSSGGGEYCRLLKAHANAARCGGRRSRSWWTASWWGEQWWSAGWQGKQEVQSQEKQELSGGVMAVGEIQKRRPKSVADRT